MEQWNCGNVTMQQYKNGTMEQWKKGAMEQWNCSNVTM